MIDVTKEEPRGSSFALQAAAGEKLATIGCRLS
jgi:hypothetical protein